MQLQGAHGSVYRAGDNVRFKLSAAPPLATASAVCNSLRKHEPRHRHRPGWKNGDSGSIYSMHVTHSCSLAIRPRNNALCDASFHANEFPSAVEFGEPRPGGDHLGFRTLVLVWHVFLVKYLSWIHTLTFPNRLGSPEGEKYWILWCHQKLGGIGFFFKFYPFSCQHWGRLSHHWGTQPIMGAQALT